MSTLKNEKNLKVPHNVLICGKNVYFSKDAFKTWNNNNVMVVGTSGGGKTRCMVEPALLQAEGSYVVSDPKGKLYKDYAKYLESKGYEVLKMDFIHPEKSLHYNPLALCKNTQDIQKLAHVLVYSFNSASHVDPFWDQTALILLTALIGYLVEEADIAKDSLAQRIKLEEMNLCSVGKLLVAGRRADRDSNELRSAVTRIFEDHRARYFKKYNEDSWAYQRYQEVLLSAGRTYDSICISAAAKMSTFDTKEIREMLGKNDIDFPSLGKKKTAIFVEVSDTDRSMDALVNLFYTQLMNSLCTYADEQCENNRLKVPVQFILDDFATNARIDNFENMISNIRSRNISAMIMVQSESQLEAGYGKSASTIVNNCSTYVYLGGTDPKMAELLAPRVNKTAHSILNMPVNMCYVCRRGSEEVYTEHFDLPWFEKEKGFVRGKRYNKKKNYIARGKKER